MIKILYVLSWIPVALLKLALAVIGLIVVPIALRNEQWPRWAWLWGNDEDGYPDWARKRNMSPFWWYAVRNPVNNFRFLFNDRDVEQCTVESNYDQTIPMEAKQMLDAGQQSAYLWIWSGPFAGYRRVWLNGFYKYEAEFGLPAEQQSGYGAYSYSEIWFGWKLGSGVPGLGFTTQVRLNREIGQ